MTKCLTLFLVPAVLTISASALAADECDDQVKDGYSYCFGDDKLLAADGDGVTPLIKLRPTAQRQTLIRPRTSFVAEMLKTIENL